MNVETKAMKCLLRVCQDESEYKFNCTHFKLFISLQACGLMEKA